MTRPLACILAALAAITFSSRVAAGNLNLTIDGIRNADGSILVLVFDSAAAFEQLDWGRVAGYADIPAKAGRVSHNFPDLNTGPYAIFVLHDENGDLDLNYSRQRLLEGVGATGAPTPTSNPSFRDAAVQPGSVTVRIFYDR